VYGFWMAESPSFDILISGREESINKVINALKCKLQLKALG